MKLEKGEYFSDSLEHYAARYLYPTNIRIHYFIFSLILVLGALMCFKTFMHNYTHAPLPFIIYAQDQVLYYPILKPLATKREPIETSTARYLVERYIKLREDYDSENFTDENKELYMQKIRALSSIESYYNFEKYINPESNTNSPILMYQNKYIREIKILSTDWFDDTIDGTGADIEYEATLLNKFTKESQVTKKRIRVKYTLSDLEQIINKTAKFYFAVIDYKTY